MILEHLLLLKKIRNINSDSYLRYGVNSRVSKIVDNMKNPVEHYFQYIDPEIQILDLQEMIEEFQLDHCG